MGYKYVYVSSADRQGHDLESKMVVRLSEPIHRAVSVQVVGASFANEFWNIKQGNQKKEMWIYDILANGSPSDLAEVSVLFQPGLYSTEDLLTEFNTQMAAIPAADRKSVTITAQLLSGWEGRDHVFIDSNAEAKDSSVF